ncbi:unnamed protein product [Camellia sinensis]
MQKVYDSFTRGDPIFDSSASSRYDMASVERWRIKTRTFNFPVGDSTVTLQDVAILFGLPVDEHAVTGKDPGNKLDDLIALCVELLGAAPTQEDFIGSSLKLKWISEHFRHLPHDASDETVHHYARSYIMWLIRGVLVPDKSQNIVKMMFLPLLRDFDHIQEYNWGGATLACLYRMLCQAIKADTKEIVGPLVLLQVWGLDTDRLATLLAKERSHSLTYIGCIKKGLVYEESGHLIEVVPSLAITRHNSETVTSYRHHLEKKHDMLLGMLFGRGTYKKLYSYRHLINGFAIQISPEQAEILRRAPGVKFVERDWKVRRLTTHTPQFLGLPTGVWPTGGGFERAGEDIVIGFVDSGIYPLHPSFATYNTEPYGPVPKYRGKCEVDPDTKRNFCNGKIIGAQHFVEATIAAGIFNPAIDFASPLDGDGHGTAIAAGNNGIPVRVYGYGFGKASGMAPRARIAVYKALYRLFGGYVADVVAAIEQIDYVGMDTVMLLGQIDDVCMV